MTTNTPIRMVIAGGGTGGHVLPAVAVLEAFDAMGQAVEPLWIGSAAGLEREAAGDAGVPFRAIQTGKLRRYIDRRTPLDLGRIPFGFGQAWRILDRHTPDVVFSTGGFVSVPTVLAAARRFPILTHEQTAILGLATRINLRVADVVAVSYEATAELARRRHRRVVTTGNPVRPSLQNGDRNLGLARFGFDATLPVLYVTGGARGATPLNRLVGGLLPELLNDCQVIHQAGPVTANTDVAALENRARSWPDALRRRYHVTDFIRDELPDVYAAADLVLGRAGAGTVAELAYLGMPAILVPLAGTGGDEQTRNARMLADTGAAVLLPESETRPGDLRDALTPLLASASRRQEMAAKARTVGRHDAAAQLAQALMSLARPAADSPGSRRTPKGRQA